MTLIFMEVNGYLFEDTKRKEKSNTEQINLQEQKKKKKKKEKKRTRKKTTTTKTNTKLNSNNFIRGFHSFDRIRVVHVFVIGWTRHIDRCRLTR